MNSNGSSESRRAKCRLSRSVNRTNTKTNIFEIISAEQIFDANSKLVIYS